MNLERVNSEIKKELSVIIRDEVKDPRLESAIITITRVNVTADLKHGKVWVSILSDETKSKIDALNTASNFMRATLFKRLKIRAVPELKFIIDDGAEYYVKIEKMLDELKMTSDE
ncbi:MAG: 30S ribosome-binding factor RbfA [Christensenellaceae bacterium]|jgi:ribosome-binding factor A|nr:30S ribosome-binding factor RbfA [Christensenellaceae bacterium]